MFYQQKLFTASVLYPAKTANNAKAKSSVLWTDQWSILALKMKVYNKQVNLGVIRLSPPIVLPSSNVGSEHLLIQDFL